MTSKLLNKQGKKILLLFCGLFGLTIAVYQTHGYMLNQKLLLAVRGPDKAELVNAVMKGADVDAVDDFGSTALSLAARRGDQFAVEYLLDNGANVRIPNHFGQTALMWAATRDWHVKKYAVDARSLQKSQSDSVNGGVATEAWGPPLTDMYKPSTEILQRLIDAGADINAKDEKGNTPLMWAFNRQFGPIPLIVRFLLVNGADPNVQNHHGTTALMLVARGFWDSDDVVLKLLIENKAEIHIRDKNDWSAVVWACWGSVPAFMEILVPPPDMILTLPEAACLGNTEMCRRLIAQGADVNKKGPFNRTPLMCAARGGSNAVARLLLSKGAYLQAKDSFGLTARDIARERANRKVEELFVEAEELSK